VVSMGSAQEAIAASKQQQQYTDRVRYTDDSSITFRKEAEIDRLWEISRDLTFTLGLVRFFAVLKEAWLWRHSEGRAGSYAFKARLLLLENAEITFKSTFLSLSSQLSYIIKQN